MNRTVFSVAAVGALLLVVACSSSASAICNRESPCPNDVPATQAQKDQCVSTLKANESSDCYNEVVTYVECQLDNVVCGGDQKTDGKLSATQAENNCKNQKADAVACCTKSPSATACK